jgi:ABC-type multidrug transport system ATPase subunit
MKLLVTQILPSGGGVSVDGADLYRNDKAFKKRLGYLPQDFGLYDELTVWQFLDYLAAAKGIGQRERSAAIETVLERTSLSERRKDRIRTLSGGMKQRVGIAQALLGAPDLLIVDEPTVGLDPEERIRFRNLFSKVSDNRIVIFSTHIIDDVESICNRLVVLNEGVVHFDGKPDELIRRARGHVAQLEDPSEMELDARGLTITSRVPTGNGIRCRVVGDELPGGSAVAEPTLEDAYLYCLHGSDDHADFS